MKKTKNNIKESELQGFCDQYFMGQGFLTRGCKCLFLFKVADLFCLHERTGKCIAVEVKVRNWRQALGQALVYQMMADHVYIALASKHIRAVDYNLLVSKGVGLLAVGYFRESRFNSGGSFAPRRLSYFVSSVVAAAFPGRGSLACLML